MELANPPAKSGPNVSPQRRGRSARKRAFSTTMATIRQDPHDVNARLEMVQLLQEDERVGESVEELMRVAAVYIKRNIPVKAVAVLRQAVRIQPDRPELRMAYGEVFSKLEMIEDAAREYRHAYHLYKQADNLTAMLDALSGLTRLDPGNLEANLLLAEALSRAGRSEQAARVFRELADYLQRLKAFDDWEKVAERAVFHSPEDVALAHDLALRYVRTNRHEMALSKLLLCLELEPNDVELHELIVDTFERLGQYDRAAAVMRQLVERYRAAGLSEEEQSALERLYLLAPDERDAKEAMGALHPAVEPETVIELTDDALLPEGAGFASLEIDDVIDDLIDEQDLIPEDAHDEQPVELFEPDRLPEDSVLTEHDDGAPIMTEMMDVSTMRAANPLPRPHRPLSKTAIKAAQPPPEYPHEIEFAASDEPTLYDDNLMDQLRALDGGKMPPSKSNNHRASSSLAKALSSQRPSQRLPRPRLTRHKGVQDAGHQARSVNSDLQTLDFFIERGFYDSAVALIGELEKRYPDSEEVRQRRQRVASMGH